MQKTARATKINGFEIDVYSNRLLYITGLINLMTTCIEDGNPYTENICNILLSLNILEDLILSKPGNFSFKLEVTNFFFNCHLKN